MNILCLGMSYPNHEYCIEQAFRLKPKQMTLIHTHTCPMQAIELVRRNVLTEMDGRDLARLIALEELELGDRDRDGVMVAATTNTAVAAASSNKYQAYTVSMEEGDIYKSNRHYTGNFNRGLGFVVRMMEHFVSHANLESYSSSSTDVTPVVQFRKIILDYFWIPKGSWSMTHWRKSFFAETLPCFVEQNMFCPNAIQSGDAAIYLPFCVRCLSQVFSNIKQLSSHFQISFLSKDLLSEVELWKGTQNIDADEMQSWLGKKRNQEDIYCTIESKDINEVMEDELGVSKEEMKNLLNRIPNLTTTRMIKLTVATDANGVSPRGIVGLKPIFKRKKIDHSNDTPVNIIERVRKMRKKRVTHLDVLTYWEEDSDAIHWQNPITERLHLIRASGTLATMSSPEKSYQQAVIDEQNKLVDPDELWHLDCIFSIREMLSSNPLKCNSPDCSNIACSQWISDTAPEYKTWSCCLCCQEKHFGGWPLEDMGNEKNIVKDLVFSTVASKCCQKYGSKSSKWRGPWAEEEIILLTLACKVCHKWNEISQFVGSRSTAQVRSKCTELNLEKDHDKISERGKNIKPAVDERSKIEKPLLPFPLSLPNVSRSTSCASTEDMTSGLASTSCSSDSPFSSEMYDYRTSPPVSETL